MATGFDALGYAGKRVVVSGCFSGIGQAAARQLSELGAEVHGLDVRAGDPHLKSFTQLDLRDPVAIDAVTAKFPGPVDALFNCAGIAPGRPPFDVMKVNYVGTRYLTDRLLPLMGEGSAIVNVSSNGGMGWRRRLPELLQLASASTFSDGVRWCEDHPALVAEGYRLSKEALIVWTMLGGTQLIKRQVRMNCTMPGAVQTPMLEEIEKVTPTATIDAVAEPIGRRSTAEEQAAVLLFLNSSLATYINGAVLPVDGGFLASVDLKK